MEIDMRTEEPAVIEAGRSSREVLCVVRWPVGGIRTYLLYYYPHLQERGYRFTFLGPAGGELESFRNECAGVLDARVISAPVEKGRWRIARPVRRLLASRRYSLVHSQGISAGGMVGFAGLGLGVPHVVTSHDVFPPGKFDGLLAGLRVRVLEQMLLRSSAVVSVSEGAARNLEERMPRLGRGRSRHVTILNGIDVARFGTREPGDGRLLHRQLDLPEDTVVLGFLGRFMEQKGFLPLLDALDLLHAAPPRRPYHLVAVGSGDYQREYRAEVLRRGLGERVTFLPFQPDPGPILAGLDLLVMPSLWEAAPLLPMEAMVLGVPVVGSSCVGLSDVLAGSPSRTVPPGDVGAWCRALKESIDALWESEARAYIPVARARFDRATGAARLCQLFDEVLRERA
ncbi:MAG: glycosyltransferase family 4 protein [Acidobacteria bacterium]|nr:glycosyltransferase family 4 protein [Acidobacteriota bacterium]